MAKQGRAQHRPPLTQTENIDTRPAVRQARALFGAWSDLDWEATVHALDAIRRESRPTLSMHADLDRVL